MFCGVLVLILGQQLVGVFWFLGLRSFCVCKQEYFQQNILQLCMSEWSAVNSHNNLILSGFLGFRKLLLTPAVFPCTLTEYSTPPFQRHCHFSSLLLPGQLRGRTGWLSKWHISSVPRACPISALFAAVPHSVQTPILLQAFPGHHCQPKQCQRRSPGRQTDRQRGWGQTWHRKPRSALDFKPELEWV